MENFEYLVTKFEFNYVNSRELLKVFNVVMTCFDTIRSHISNCGVRSRRADSVSFVTIEENLVHYCTSKVGS